MHMHFRTDTKELGIATEYGRSEEFLVNCIQFGHWNIAQWALLQGFRIPSRETMSRLRCMTKGYLRYAECKNLLSQADNPPEPK